MSDPNTGRLAFGKRLRGLRIDAGLSGKELATRLGWAASKVSRLEHGRQAATGEDLSAWITATGASDETHDDLATELRSLRIDYATWRSQFRKGGFARLQWAQAPLEASARTVRVFEPSIIPGLLQSPDYARHVFLGLARLPGRGRDIDEGVHARMRRQEVLYQPGRQFRFLLTEAALRYLLCPPAVLRAQLERLLVLAALPTVDLAIVPMDARLPHMIWNGFWIFDEAVVLVETVSSELSLRDVDDVEIYTQFFESLWKVAHREDGAVAVLHRLIAQLGDAQ